ncbi:hypothetical protein L2E82_37603 [Cichorium intybus]|uniref:Uncharacterized protein n=1 Tax=Cichorium intybus TaxID=13427 RepID=A0ACB9ADX8_CICIN|nr:hypothetical protein L2E82_37603 [Cichorium intybus]
MFLFFFLLSASTRLFEASNNGDGGFKFEENEEPHIKRSDFPPGFLFGAGTSAYQVEGAYLEDAKSLSNWDVFCHSVGCGENGENGDIADDHYHLFLKDIELMHSLGLKAYKFSVSWSRILPRGRSGEVNPAGILFYNKIIDNLILRGIEPFVMLFHFDFPSELEEIYGSWLNPEMQEEFVHLAEICYKTFGDRVKYWITMNEPNLFIELSYQLGIFPPCHCSKPFGDCNTGNSDPKQGGSIGLVVHGYMYEPLTDSELDREAAKRAFAFDAGWALDPLIFGDYPKEMREYLGSELPIFSIDEENIMKNSIDFIGIDHYSSVYTKDCTNSTCSPIGNRAIRGFVDIVTGRDGVLIGEPTGVKLLYVVPSGMKKIVDQIKIRYNNKPMFITENGYSSPNVHEERVNVILNDVKRVEFHTKYLASLVESIREGADVRGYFIWTLMDNYEWLRGYKVRFGLYYVDRQTLTRIPKLSAKWPYGSEWKDVRRRWSLKSKSANTSITSFYVSNLSGDVRKAALWKSHSMLGNLVDVYIAGPPPSKPSRPHLSKSAVFHPAPRDDRSFADVEAGKYTQMSSPSIVLSSVQEIKDWSSSAVLVGEAKSFDNLCNFPFLVGLEGYDVSDVKFLVLAWDDSNFEAVAGRFGKILVSPCSFWNCKDISVGKMCILTALGRKNNDEVTVELDGSQHRIGEEDDEHEVDDGDDIPVAGEQNEIELEDVEINQNKSYTLRNSGRPSSGTIQFCRCGWGESLTRSRSSSSFDLNQTVEIGSRVGFHFESGNMALLGAAIGEVSSLPLDIENWWGSSEVEIEFVESVGRRAPDRYLSDKLRVLKESIQNWRRVEYEKENRKLLDLKEKVSTLDLEAESRVLNPMEVVTLRECKQQIFELEKLAKADLLQKSKVK